MARRQATKAIFGEEHGGQRPGAELAELMYQPCLSLAPTAHGSRRPGTPGSGRTFKEAS
jgi:hypothetical protein